MCNFRLTLEFLLFSGNSKLMIKLKSLACFKISVNGPTFLYALLSTYITGRNSSVYDNYSNNCGLILHFHTKISL